MSLAGSNTNVSTSNSEVIAASSGKRLNVFSLLVLNADAFANTLVVKDGATELHRHPIPAGGEVSLSFGEGEDALSDLCLTSGAALNVAAVTAPTANSLRVYARYGRRAG